MRATGKKPIRFARYLLLERIRIGGMAEVWRAVETDGARRTVAVKRLLPNVAEHPELVSMFIAEAKIMLQLAHPNIAQAYELGEAANSHFISLEYIRGQDLREIFERSRRTGRLAPIPMICDVISQLCSALDYVHRWRDESGCQSHLVHRDVSPSNVLVGFGGEVKLVDFGIAQADDACLADSGVPNGKLAYMSPEQARGLPIDRRSDIFSVGICLYEMLTGKRLFAGDSHPSFVSDLPIEIPSAVKSNPNIPPSLEAILLKALASDPRTRYQYANELGADLQRFLLESGNHQAKELVTYMQSTFAEEIEQEQQLSPSVDDSPPLPLSLLPKAVAAGALLTNAVLEDSGEMPPDSSAIEDRPALEDAPSPPEESVSHGSWSPPVRVSDAVRASVRAFSEIGRPPEPPTPSGEAADGETAPKSSPAIGRGKAVALGMAGAAVVLAVAVAVYFVTEEADSGFLSIDLPADLKGKNVALAFRGQPLQVPEQGRLVHKAKAGGGLLMIQAEGYQLFSQNVEVKSGHAVTEVPAKLTPLLRNAQLAVLADPEDAEVRVNGSVVASGGGSTFYLSEIPVGVERLVQVRRAGYRSFESRVKASKAGEQVKVHAKLQPMDYSIRVESSPRGAIVWANGARLGRTPIDVQVPAALTELTLSKRCYQAVQVPVSTADEASEPEPINVSLKRLPSCAERAGK